MAQPSNYSVRTTSGIRVTVPQVEEVTEEWNLIHGKEWIRVAVIGSGGFGSVYIGLRVEDQMVFAVKSTPLVWKPLSKIMDHLHALRNEIRTLQKIRSKYIVRMLGCGKSNAKNSKIDIGGMPMLDLFLEYIPRGSLYHMMQRLQMGLTTAKSDLKSGIKNPAESERFRRLPESFVRAYTADILRGVDYLHRQHLVHGDIKTLNLLMADDSLKLADFGGCKSLKLRRLDVFQARTRLYAAPEVFYKIEQGLASDIFSVGCCVLEMTSGKVPKHLFIPQWLSKDGQNFLRRCLTTDPSKRWTAAQLLEHPFIRDRDHKDMSPYSTAVPQSVGNKILQPPPIEIYSNPLLSPTYWGCQAYVAPADPIILAARIAAEPGSFRKENIEISVPPPTSDSDGFIVVDNKTSNHSSKPAVLHPIQQRTAAAEAAAAQASSDSDETSGGWKLQPYPKPQVPSKSGTGSKPDPKTTSSASGDFKSALQDLDLDQKEREPPMKLPDYRPEFAPPDDKSLHFLLGPEDAKKGKAKADDLDAGAAAPGGSRHPWKLAEVSPKSNMLKPNLVGETGDQPGYVTLIPNAISNLSAQDLKQLNEALPNIQECNEEIKDEAILAEKAGIYTNKLCPGATQTRNRRGENAKTRKSNLVQSVLHAMNLCQTAVTLGQCNRQDPTGVPKTPRPYKNNEKGNTSTKGVK